MPFITTAATGSLAYALIYPIAVPAVCLVLSLFLMPETRRMSIWEHEGQPAKFALHAGPEGGPHVQNGL